MGILLALLGALAFSFMNVFIRNGSRPDDSDTGVLTTLLINVAIFTVLIVSFTLIQGALVLDPEAVAWFALAGFSATYMGRQTLFGGIRHLGAARAAAIKNATPLVTVAIALGLLGERLTLLAGAGIGLVALGVAALIVESLRGAEHRSRQGDGPDPVERAFESEAIAEGGVWELTRGLADRTRAMMARPSARSALLGIGLSALAALAFGAGHALRKVGMEILPDALLGAAIGSWTALLTYLLQALLRREARAMVASMTSSFRPWFWAAGLAGTVGQLSFFAALRFSPVSHVSVVSGSETVMTVALAALLAGRIEAITRYVVVPAVLVFAGVALIGLAG